MPEVAEPVAEPVVEQNLTMTEVTEPSITEPSIKMSISEAFMNEDELGLSIELEQPFEEDLAQPINQLPEEVNGDKQVDDVEPPMMVPQNPIVEVQTTEPVTEKIAEVVIEKTLSAAELYMVNSRNEEQIMRDNLLSLYSFGFEDFETNKKLLAKFC
jgi:hypothetical protein